MFARHDVVNAVRPRLSLVMCSFGVDGDQNGSNHWIWAGWMDLKLPRPAYERRLVVFPSVDYLLLALVAAEIGTVALVEEVVASQHHLE